MNIADYQSTIEWYDDHAEEYSRKCLQSSLDSAEKREIEEFTENLGKNAKILDAGCGSGVHTNVFNKMGFKVTGIDISNGMLKEARKSFPNIDFRYGDLLDLHLNEKFDGIWAHASLVHFDSDDQINKAMDNLYNVLRKGGVIHLVLRGRKRGERKNFVFNDNFFESQRFYCTFIPDEVRDLLEERNMTILKLYQYNEKDVNQIKQRDVSWVCALARK